MNPLTNPEMVRNARIQLRPRKLLIAAVLCAAIEVTLYYAFFHGRVAVSSERSAYGGGPGLLHVILVIQGLVLVLGGGIACLHGVQREKDQNTFDFQRITRLSPLELTLGKLFGAPLMPFFVFLCFIPAAIVGAVAARTPATILLAAYVILILGAVVYDAFALTVSLFLRRGAVTWAILFFLLFVGFTSSSTPLGEYLAFGSVSPFIAVDLVKMGSWSLAPTTMRMGPRSLTVANAFHDVFFGATVHHALVLFIFYVTVLAWLIPAVARNIKRDPTNYELYTPAQALGFLCYLNFILFAFFRWHFNSVGKHFAPLEAQSALLGVNVLLFFIFGFVLLRNRHQVRRALHSANRTSMGRLELWPAQHLLLGAAIVGAAMILWINWKRDPSLEWSLAVAIYRVAFFAFWIICDFLFLQWMKLRRAGHPLLVGVLYLAVYYFCVAIVVSVLHVEHNPFAAIVLPTPLFALNSSLWAGHVPIWLLALAVQIAAGIVFVFLQRQRLAELRPHAAAPLAGVPAAGSPTR